MSEDAARDVPFVQSVFHPSDFSEASLNAFAHALVLALVRQTDLTLLHVGREYLAEDEWSKFPPIRRTLEHWGLLDEGSARSAILDEFNVRVNKVNLQSLAPFRAVVKYLDEHPTDVIVLATEGRKGMPRWLRSSAAEKLARRTRTNTLFVPNSARGFVSLQDGEVNLRRVLVPVDRRPDPTAAVVIASRTPALTGGEPVEIILLHVGDAADMPAVERPEAPACSYREEQRSGDVVEQILAAAREHEVDLIAMTTSGGGILDALSGTNTEQVLRQAPCPVLAVQDKSV
jgi:nucleotide-binding universal stress UspA family protein